jgi:hypothetical protein
MDRVELVGLLRQAAGVALVLQPLPLEEAGFSSYSLAGPVPS